MLNQVKAMFKKPVFRIGKKLLGFVLIGVGITGLFLPFVQGIALIVLGAVMIENKWLIAQTKAFRDMVMKLFSGKAAAAPKKRARTKPMTKGRPRKKKVEA